ncbi:MAG: hypothetical protein WA123_06985 [Methylotenera sp.]
MSGTTLFLIVAAIIVALGWSRFKEWKTKRLALKRARLEDELKQLCGEISTYSTLRLTGEHLPQRFPSKQAALEFGEKWSRGGKEGYKVKSVDDHGRDEDHPSFDGTSTPGGILYTYPALFFGMTEPYKDNEQWFIEFAEAKNKWLKNYLTHLKSSPPNSP